jgi:hypothetical protein
LEASIMPEKMQRCPRSILSLFLLALAAAAAVTGCGGGGDKSPFYGSPAASAIPEIFILGSKGDTGSIPLEGEATLIRMTGMVPYAQYDIWVSRGTADEKYLRVTTDREGNLPLTPLAYNLPSGEYPYEIYKVLDGTAVSLTDASGSFGVRTAAASCTIRNADGDAVRSFSPGETVFIAGSGLPGDAEVDVYIVNDRLSWEEGELLRDVSGTLSGRTDGGGQEPLDSIGAPNRVRVGPDGRFPATRIWTIPQDIAAGSALDVIIDVNRNGFFDASTDIANDHFGVGFVIQTPEGYAEPSPGADYSARLACDAMRNYRDIFLTTEDIYVYLAPASRMETGAPPLVKKYIVRHQHAWNDGDPLVDVSGPSAANWWNAGAVEDGSTAQGRFLVWPAPTRPGAYDVIIDVNRNDTYDHGIDIIDGSATSPGFVVKPPARPADVKNWTVLVYLNADNNLESAGIRDINEMEQVGSSAEVNILVQIDRTPGWDATNGDWTGARRYYVTRDADPSLIHSTLLEDIGEVNMGDPGTLTDFVLWGVANYPANHYLLVIWNHGSGFKAPIDSVHRDISYDDTFGASISIPELASSLSGIKAFLGRNLDIVGMDACLMAMVEVAHEIRNYADYMVASQETEPLDGWPYHLFLQRLIDSPTALPEQLSRWIVYDYAGAYTSPVTQSAVDLVELPALTAAIDVFARAMIEGMEGVGGGGIKTALQQIRLKTHAFYYSDYRDLYHFAQNVAADTEKMTLPIIAAAESVLSALGASIVANGVNGALLGNAGGLSIWLPDGSQLNNHIAKYGQLAFAGHTAWKTFLAKLLGLTLRVELTWGREPADLDCHLWDVFGNYLYYANPAMDGAWLDRDDVNGFGPENVRIEYLLKPDGTSAFSRYLFAVHFYAGSPSSERVTVKVFDGGELVARQTFTKEGFTEDARWWSVFEIDPFTNDLIAIDTYSASPPARHH